MKSNLMPSSSLNRTVEKVRCVLRSSSLRLARNEQMVRRRDADEPLIADHCNYYKMEKWIKDSSKIDHILYAGSDLEKARKIFAAAIKHRPRIRLTIRQRSLVLEQWPKAGRRWEVLSVETIVAVGRRPFRRSILFQVLAGADLWLRRSPAPPCTARSIVADVR